MFRTLVRFPILHDHHKPTLTMAFSRADEFNREPFIQSAIAKAIAHPARIEILMYVQKHGSPSFGAIKARIPLSRTTVSFHVRVLRIAGLIRPYQEGEHTYYEIDEEQCYLYFTALLPLIKLFVYPPL